MNKLDIIHFIGCGVLAPDIKHIAGEKSEIALKMTFLPGGLHDKPNELRLRLQSAIDNAARDERCCRIVVGYGICGRGSVGINAPHVPLVFPRVHDCIALFMGSDESYRREFARSPGTFYLSAGWCMEKGRPLNSRDRDSKNRANLGDHKKGEDSSISRVVSSDEKIWIGSEPMGCLELKRKYGDAAGDKIIGFFSSWQKNYQRAAFIDTGLGNSHLYSQQAQNMADEYGWKYEQIEGDTSLMQRLLTQKHSDDAILIVPPRHCTIYCALKNGLDSAPVIADRADNMEKLGKDSNHQMTEDAIRSGSNHDRIRKDSNQDKSSRGSNEEEGRELLIRYGLGIDAGGTYTDAVVYDFHDKRIIAKNKALTTKWDFSIGIQNALTGLSDSDLLSKVELVSVSTTLATNAIVEGEGQKTGLILMNSAGVVSDDLIAHTPKRNIGGYINISGEEIEPVDEDEVRKVVREMTTNDGVTAFAVSGFGGAINPAHELTVKQIVEQETGMVACCGHQLSDLLNFVVRAQTAVLNARIIPRMIKFFSDIDLVLQRFGISAPVMVVKGDGTLISSEMARDRPVETILSGPAASVAGAKLLTGLTDAMVVDMGGTTTDTADICDNMVAVCEDGAKVGGFATHVKALDMRTVGLGGDSLIKWKHGEFTIGPRRVGPLVWAANLDRSGVSKALNQMEQRQLSHLDQVLFVATASMGSRLPSSNYPPLQLSPEQVLHLPGSKYYKISSQQPIYQFPFKPTAHEIEIYELLSNRPYTPEELASAINCLSTLFLPVERLEESGLVQRCGLTPTDLLHVRGDFRRWNPEPAQRLVRMMAECTKQTVNELVDDLLSKVERKLALELLKNLIFKDIRKDKQQEREKKRMEQRNETFDMEIENSPVSRHLIASMLDPSSSSRYRIRAEFCHPVIGIGAPINYFLPKAGKLLNANVIIPPDADVANALGAITSHIMIREKLIIRPDSIGRFVVEGVAGNRGFSDINEAESWVVKYLKRSVQSIAVKAGTSRKEVSVNIDDRVVNTGNGLSLFLDRTITATLTGSPDLALRSLNHKKI